MLEKKFFNSLNWHLILMLLIGCALFLVSKYLIPVLHQIDPNVSKNELTFSGFVLTGQKGLLFLSYLVMGTSVATFLLKRIFGFVWMSSLEAPVEGFNKNIEESLGNVSRNTTRVVDEAVKIYELVKSDKTRSIDACSSEEDYMHFINHASKLIYGNHIKDEQSLYSFVLANLIMPYCCEPHQSCVFKKVDVKEYDANFVEWNEYTKLDIHHVAFQNKSSDDHYDYEYEGASLAPSISEEDWTGALELNISFDGVSFVNASTKPDIRVCRPDKEELGFFCWKEDQWIYLRYKKVFTLKRERSEMVIQEKSINSIDDTVFSINTLNPICSYRVDMTIPTDFHFRKGLFIAPELLDKGLPGYTKEKGKSLTSVNSTIDDRHLDIDIKGWIMPGIVMNINWYRTQ